MTNQNPQKLDEVFSYKTAQAAKYYPHTDMLGSVYAVSDSTGTSQASWSYDVYGTRTQTSGGLSYAFGYTGREHAGDTGLIYSRQRYYDPSVGSWLSPDRKKMVNGPNLYGYVGDRPTLMTDPMGEFCVSTAIAIALGIVVAVGIVALFASGIGEAAVAAEAVALDTNALIAAIEGGVDVLEGAAPLVSEAAQSEFLVQGSAQALEEFLAANGGQIVSNGSQGLVSALQAIAPNSVGLADLQIAASAIENGATLITGDTALARFLWSIGQDVIFFLP